MSPTSYLAALPRVVWRGLDSNQRRRKPADLQSAPFGRFGTSPCLRSSRRGRPTGRPLGRTPIFIISGLSSDPGEGDRSWRTDSNRQPAAYKAAALPLSYASTDPTARPMIPREPHPRNWLPGLSAVRAAAPAREVPGSRPATHAARPQGPPFGCAAALPAVLPMPDRIRTRPGGVQPHRRRRAPGAHPRPDPGPCPRGFLARPDRSPPGCPACAAGPGFKPGPAGPAADCAIRYSAPASA